MDTLVDSSAAGASSGTQVNTVQMQRASGSGIANNGRDKIHWSQDVWDRIDKAVHDEMMRARVAQKFLPIRPVLPRTTSVPTDSITQPTAATPALTVDEGGTTRLVEYWVEFSLTPQQLEHENGDPMELGHSTAVTLATHAANVLALAEDTVIFQGANAITNSKLFNSAPPSVLNRGGGQLVDTGLLNIGAGAAAVPNGTAITVLLLEADAAGIYGSNTFKQIAAAYATLQGIGQYGPYAVALPTGPYADTFAPITAGVLAAGFVLTADRIKPLMTGGFFGSGALSVTNMPTTAAGPVGSSVGVVVSLGGNTMDLVVGLDATVAFMQQDSNGNYLFRVVERFALRLKDPTAAILLVFQ